MPIKEFYNSELKIEDINILEAAIYDEEIVFNESYTIIGKKIEAKKIHGCYNLTVLCDILADEIVVNGDLIVNGNLSAKTVNCEGNFMVSGAVKVENLFAGADLIAGEIITDNIDIKGNLLIKNALDIKETINSDGYVIVGDGISGQGEYSAKGSIAVEYFDFDGDINGTITELNSHSQFGEPYKNKENIDNINTERLLCMLNENIRKEITKAYNTDQNALETLISQWAKLDENEICSWNELLKYIIRLSNTDEIENLRDYLALFYAVKVFPEELQEYEAINHVFTVLMPTVFYSITKMPYKADNIEELALSLHIVAKYGPEIPYGSELIYDKIFQSIGLRYETVKMFIDK